MLGEDITLVLGIVGSLIAIASAVVGSLFFVWQNAKKAGRHEADIKGLKEAFGKIDTFENRLTVMETRFEPFLRVINESVTRLFPSNPLDITLKDRIEKRTASIEEIRKADHTLKEEMHEMSKEEYFSSILVRYWLNAKLVELERGFHAKP